MTEAWSRHPVLKGFNVVSSMIASFALLALLGKTKNPKEKGVVALKYTKELLDEL